MYFLWLRHRRTHRPCHDLCRRYDFAVPSSPYSLPARVRSLRLINTTKLCCLDATPKQHASASGKDQISTQRKLPVRQAFYRPGHGNLRSVPSFRSAQANHLAVERGSCGFGSVDGRVDKPARDRSMHKLLMTSLLLIVVSAGLASCRDEASLPVSAGTGPHPK